MVLLPFITRPLRASTLSRVPFKSTSLFVRYNSNLPSNFDPKKDLPTQGEWKHMKHHIPGESVQKNDLKSRIPKFPLGKEIVPTLLPRPGVPQVGDNFSFRQVVSILKRKTKPELIYEAEPHKLYFLALICFGIVFTAYGLVLFEYGTYEANETYKENAEEKPENIRYQDWIVNTGLYTIPGCGVLFLAWQAVLYPTRLIRRMWYLPGPKPHIKFTLYPFFPGRATPVYTVPLENLVRSKRSKVWTGKGFYGTADNSLFFFILKETHGRLWVVDRKGFFWSDGRVFDLLFGNETIEEAELGVPMDEKYRRANVAIKNKEKELKNEHGLFWRPKLMFQEMKKDVKKLTGAVSGKDVKKTPKIEAGTKKVGAVSGKDVKKTPKIEAGTKKVAGDNKLNDNKKKGSNKKYLS